MCVAQPREQVVGLSSVIATWHAQRRGACPTYPVNLGLRSYHPKAAGPCVPSSSRKQ